jgi:hypothetical protein
MCMEIYINILSLHTVCKLQDMLRNAGLKQTPGDLLRAFKKTFVTAMLNASFNVKNGYYHQPGNRKGSYQRCGM